MVAAPNAMNGVWQMQNTPWWSEEGDGPPDINPDIDDVAFVGDMAACIASLGVPLSRTAVLAGYSVGAMFAARVACAPPRGLTIAAAALSHGIQSEVAPRGCVGAPLLLFSSGVDINVPLCRRATLWDAILPVDWAYDALQPKLDAWIHYNGGDTDAPGQSQCAAAPHDGGVFDSDTQLFVWPGRPGVLTALLWQPTGIHAWPRWLAGCDDNTDGVDFAIAFYLSALAGAVTVVPPTCRGLAPCTPKLPCDAPISETFVSSW